MTSEYWIAIAHDAKYCCVCGSNFANDQIAIFERGVSERDPPYVFHVRCFANDATSGAHILVRLVTESPHHKNAVIFELAG
jgi:hypothetical protein